MKDFSSLLRTHTLSVTQARIDILKTLADSQEPVTIDQLGKQLSLPTHPTTLYRSLKVLVDAGVVYQTDFRDGAAYYEFQSDHHHHHHLVCTVCKKRVSIDLCIHHMVPEIEQETNFQVTSHLLELFGVCKSCQKISTDSQ